MSVHDSDKREIEAGFMKKVKTNIRLKTLLPMLTLVLLLSTLVVFFEYKIELVNISDEHLVNVRKAQGFLDKEFGEDSANFSFLVEQFFQDPAIKQAFLASDRQTLLELTKPLYELIHSEYHVTHLYFHQLDKRCFLRVHHPSRFGDVIERHTMAVAAEQGQPSCGVELGPLGLFTQRYVSPWWADGELIGYVEVGRGIDVIVRDMKRIMDLDFVTAINKSFVDQPGWQQGQKMLGRSSDWDLLEDMVITDQTLKEIPDKLLAHIKQTCHQHDACSQTPLFENQKMEKIVGSFPLVDAGDRTVGRMFVIRDITAEKAIIFRTAMFFGIIVFVTGMFASGIYYIYVSRIDRRLKKSYKKLQAELLHRKFTEVQLKDAKERAEVANKAKSEFLANMSHELRTPMNAIIGFSDLLREETATEEQRDYAETIYGSAQHLLTLINDVLDLSKIEAGRLEVTKEQCLLKRMLRQIDVMLRQGAEAKGLDYRVIVDETVPDEMMTDTKHLEQCLINLAGNAIKFTDTGHVFVRVDTLKDDTLSHVRFRVEDTGIGISKDKHKAIFESFRQADAGTSRKYGGTGLGLAISSRLIEQMGGTLTVDSEAGLGSTFTVVLPYEPVSETTAKNAL